MTFSWSDYLSVAEQLALEANSVPDVNQEAKFRIATSRAYYAAFNCALDFLVNKNNFKRYDELDDEEKKKGNSHSRVIEEFSRYSNSRGYAANNQRKKIATRLEKIKWNRISADYYNPLRTNSSISADKMANETIQSAKQIIALLKVTV